MENIKEAIVEEVQYKDVHTAILAVYERVGYVVKSGKVEFGSTKYKFAGEAEFIAAIRPALIECGLIVSPFEYTIVTNELISFKNDKQQFRVVIAAKFEIAHPFSGTAKQVVAFGEGMDTGDKAFNKAMTGAQKYALRQAFLIETGDDPDKYASTEDGGVQGEHGFKSKRQRNDLCKEILADIEAAETVQSLGDVINKKRKEDLYRIKLSEEGEAIFDNIIEQAAKHKSLLLDKEVLNGKV